MNLTSLIQKVQEPHLQKNQLEDLYDSFLHLFGTVELRLAELEKLEALFIDSSEEKTDAAKKRKWSVTPSGQELITLKRESKVIEKYMSSVKHRLYNLF